MLSDDQIFDLLTRRLANKAEAQVIRDDLEAWAELKAFVGDVLNSQIPAIWLSAHSPERTVSPYIKVRLTRRDDYAQVQSQDGSRTLAFVKATELMGLFGSKTELFFEAIHRDGTLTLHRNISPSEFAC